MIMLYVVGIGSGKKDNLTIEALSALENCDVVVGYDVYVDLVKEYISGKEFVTSGMKKEIERCEKALQIARNGKNVCVVCSGDAGVYAMASLVLELRKEYQDVEVKIVSGVTSALSGGAVLGAPLTHDFAVISLSDLLTPYELIEKRIRCACEGDFCICIYNPSSKKRHEYLGNMCKIMLEYKSENTVCGIVKNIGRDGEQKEVLTLKQLSEKQVDMFTTVFIGNSQTTVIDDFMVTPRGYKTNH
ncbi:MAG: precorrin-3B C(17)-methyltransferase [Oscillospiraceae bacterium]